MQVIELNNGVKIPQLGLGVYLAEDGQETIDAVKWALEAGYRHIDTAMIYENEKGVGIGIKESKIPREEIFLTTKLWNEDIRQGRAKEAFQESLSALQTDYIDLYLTHWPADGFEQAWTELEEIYQSGKIKAIGVSNFHPTHFERLEKIAKIVPAVNQIESHPYFSNQDLIDFCHNKGIAVEVWSPLGGTGGNLLKDKLLNALADKYGKTPAQIALRWQIQRQVIVIPKSVRQERILSNMQVFDFVIEDEDMVAINQLNRNERVGDDPENFDF